MRFKSTRLIGLLLVVAVLILMILPGCSTKDTKPSTEPSSNGTVSNEEEGSDVQPLEKPNGTITVWGWEFVQRSTDAVMEDFKAEYPDIEVVFEVIPAGDLYQKLLLALSAGEGVPDVATVETSHLAQMVATGALEDLTEKITPYKDKMNAFKWTDATMDGKIYAMPWDSGPVALYYRRDVFEKAGYSSDPTEVAKLLVTWEDYYEVAKVIKEKTGAYMFAESKEQNGGRTFEKLMWQQGKWYFDENGNPALDSPEAIRTLEFIGRFVKEDLAENTVEWTQPWYDGMANGNVATIIGAVWMGGFLREWIAPDTGGLWGVVPLPAWEPDGIRTANDGGSNFVIPKDAKNKEAAWAYIEFMLGGEESHIKMFKATDVFPSLETTYDDPFFDEEIEYFGGQKFRRIFAELAQDIPSIQYTKNYSLANEILRNAFLEHVLNDKPADEVLKKANEELKARMAE